LRLRRNIVVHYEKLQVGRMKACKNCYWSKLLYHLRLYFCTMKENYFDADYVCDSWRAKRGTTESLVGGDESPLQE